MKRHFRQVGVFESKDLHTPNDACFKFLSKGELVFLHFDHRGDLHYLADQIRALFEQDLTAAKRRLELFK
jgi:hypothetical protein